VEGEWVNRDMGQPNADCGMNKIAISNLPILFTEYLYQPGYCFFNFFSFKMPCLVKKDFFISSKNTIWTYITLFIEAARFEVFVSNGIE